MTLPPSLRRSLVALLFALPLSACGYETVRFGNRSAQQDATAFDGDAVQADDLAAPDSGDAGPDTSQ